MPLTTELEPLQPGLSINLVNYAPADPGDWQHMFDLAQAADASGIARVVVSDQVVCGENLEAYGHSEFGGVEGGKQPTGPDGHWLEPLTCLSVVAGITSRVRLCTGILQAALRRPAVLAKTAATLDVLSGGRLELGVGVGWQREEYEAAGLEFEGRGHTLNDTLAVCQTLWSEGAAQFDSKTLKFSHIHCVPKPRQSGGVPIWVSGTINRRVVDRIVRFGSGWIPWGNDRANPIPGLAVVRRALIDAGRDPATFQVRGVLPLESRSDGKPDIGKAMDGVPALLSAGVTDFNLGTRVPTGVNAATDLLSEVVAEFHQATH